MLLCSGIMVDSLQVCPSAATTFPALDYGALEYPHQHHHHHQQHESTTTTLVENSSMVDYLLNNVPAPQPHGSTSLDKLSFADVMQFADFGPKLALNQPRISDEYGGIDPVYFLKFPVLNEKPLLQDQPDHDLMMGTQPPTSVGAVEKDQRFNHEVMSAEMISMGAGSSTHVLNMEAPEIRADHIRGGGEEEDQEEEDQQLDRAAEISTSTRLRLLGSVSTAVGGNDGKNRRKRPRTVKTSEEVESQRMTHIAVERNRRKQMNEHLRVLRALMPGSYVQRGDQASIIGGAIEFVRELEQLLQCLESQKRRRLFGGTDAGQRPIGESPPLPPPLGPVNEPCSSSSQAAPFFLSSSTSTTPNEQMKQLLDLDDDGGGGLREESAEIKSCLADIEVKLLGFDAMIKILSRRRPGQLLKTIAALEDLQFNILHTNITTVEQTVLYSFNVKVAGESRFGAEDIANSVQQIFNFIHASCSL